MSSDAGPNGTRATFSKNMDDKIERAAATVVRKGRVCVYMNVERQPCVRGAYQYKR